jgi:hypothetical protein
VNETEDISKRTSTGAQPNMMSCESYMAANVVSKSSLGGSCIIITRLHSAIRLFSRETPSASLSTGRLLAYIAGRSSNFASHSKSRCSNRGFETSHTTTTAMSSTSMTTLVSGRTALLSKTDKTTPLLNRSKRKLRSIDVTCDRGNDELDSHHYP